VFEKGRISSHKASLSNQQHVYWLQAYELTQTASIGLENVVHWMFAESSTYAILLDGMTKADWQSHQLA
jgi:hypothetical protein